MIYLSAGSDFKKQVAEARAHIAKAAAIFESLNGSETVFIEDAANELLNKIDDLETHEYEHGEEDSYARAGYSQF